MRSNQKYSKRRYRSVAVALILALYYARELAAAEIAFIGSAPVPPPFTPECYDCQAVWVINSDGSNSRALFTIHYAASTGVSLSAGGTRVTYSDDQRIRVGVVDSSGTPNDTGAVGFYPSFSPDGNRIVFWGYGGICVMNSNGTGVTQLTTEQGLAPSFSADGTRIVYEGYFTDPQTGSKSSAIFVMNADGSDHKRIFGPSATLLPYLLRLSRPTVAR